MIPSIEHTSLLPILFWLLMLPIAVFILIRTTAFWSEEGPGTILAAVKTVFAIWLTVFFVYDLSGYGFARLMQDPRLGIAFPPNSSYLSWLREPMGLKWHVLGSVPLIRNLPVLFALCAGGVVQVLIWKIPFRVGMLVFLSQLFLNIFAMALLSLVFSFFVGIEKGVDRKVPRRVAAGAAAGCGWASPACLVLQAPAAGRGRPCHVAGRSLWPSGPKLHSGAGGATPSMAALACNAGSQATSDPSWRADWGDVDPAGLLPLPCRVPYSSL
jgi:hypothetical protein